jgi:hypothetical protein
MPNYEVGKSEYTIINIKNYIPHCVDGNLAYDLRRPNTKKLAY